MSLHCSVRQDFKTTFTERPPVRQSEVDVEKEEDRGKDNTSHLFQEEDRQWRDGTVL